MKKIIFVVLALAMMVSSAHAALFETVNYMTGENYTSDVDLYPLHVEDDGIWSGVNHWQAVTQDHGYWSWDPITYTFSKTPVPLDFGTTVEGWLAEDLLNEGYITPGTTGGLFDGSQDFSWKVNVDGTEFLSTDPWRMVTFDIGAVSYGGTNYSQAYATFWEFGPDVSLCSADWEDASFIVGTTAPVPEPATMILFGAGLAGMTVMRKVKRKTS